MRLVIKLIFQLNLSVQVSCGVPSRSVSVHGFQTDEERGRMVSFLTLISPVSSSKNVSRKGPAQISNTI